MKTSVSLSVFQGAKTAPILFMGSTEENFRTIKELGYDGIDLFVDDPTSDATKDAVKYLIRYDLGVGVVMPAALAGQGLFLGDEDKSVRNKCIQKISEIIKFAEAIDGMVSLGLVRGSSAREESLAHFYSKFVDSCEKLISTTDMPLLIEPINRYEINTINSVQEGIDFINKYKLPLYLMIDTFHMNIEDVSIEQALRDSFSLTKHIHFLDSNRLAPSMGHLDMEGLYRTAAELGYNGYLCLEALAKPTAYECAKRGAEFFKKVKK
ncbi:sugar phosphate isomerase/epimerase family protein [Candidatus Epulonipiscium viviparus]|uniref:sugar phosphate isomerase/epimerase family protein n=1 Tax=Candidatus Epulonipiscium viviparus TaxID=420336 RepID=UPI00016BFB04|nr:sugar phosphate isomerase/epimerase family protein [Candidatus Epulopiscium viviparus]